MIGSKMFHSCLHDDGSSSIFDKNRFPMSRDWAFESLSLSCLRITCPANINKQCVMPSVIKINAKGVCIGAIKRRKKDGSS